jgi:uncharacterized protein (TIGR03435 family)
MKKMVLLASLLLSAVVSAQSSSSGAAPDRYEIEVATVKQNKAGGGQNMQLTPAGLFTITNMPLRLMARIAYGSEAIQTNGQVVGGPGWADTERFDIAAKTTVAPSPRRDIMQLVMRSVIEDRFQIKVHTEQRETPIYTLVLANRDGRFGPSLTRNDGKCYGQHNPPPPDTPFDPSTFCGVRGGPGDMRYVGQTMQEIARSLANYAMIARPVIDRTALQGRYDLRVLFVPAFIDSPNGPPVANPAADSGANIFTALVEQGGLKLQGERGPAEFLVIDRAEHPAEN